MQSEVDEPIGASANLGIWRLLISFMILSASIFKQIFVMSETADALIVTIKCSVVETFHDSELYSTVYNQPQIRFIHMLKNQL